MKIYKRKKVLFEHKYGFWDWRPWRNEADAVLVIKGLKQLNKK